MRWFCGAMALLMCGCGGKKRAPSAPPLEQQVAACAEAFAARVEDEAAESAAAELAEGCPWACPDGCAGEAGLRTLAGWVAGAAGQLGQGHAAVGRLGAALAGFSALLPLPAVLSDHYRLPASEHGVPSDATVYVVLTETAAWIGEPARLRLALAGARDQAAPGGAPPGTSIDLGRESLGDSALIAWLEAKQGRQPGYGSSGRVGTDTGLAPLILCDGSLPVARLAEAVRQLNDDHLAARLAVAGPDGSAYEHELSLRAPTGSGDLPATGTVAELVRTLDGLAAEGRAGAALAGGRVDRARARAGSFGSGSISGPIGLGYGSGGSGGGARSTISIATPTVVGDIDKDTVRRYLRRARAEIEYCYQRRVLVQPDLEGTLVLAFRILADGRTAKVKVTGLDAEVADCVSKVVKDSEFPKPEGKPADVTVPITLRLSIR